MCRCWGRKFTLLRIAIRGSWNLVGGRSPLGAKWELELREVGVGGLREVGLLDPCVKCVGGLREVGVGGIPAGSWVA